MSGMKKEGKFRVLVVDDDELVRAAVVQLMESFSFSSESCVSAEEAVRRLAGERFDLICTDLELPGMSGVELIHHVRGSGAGTPIVLMTGRGPDQRVPSAGADAFLWKPFTVDGLRAAIDSALQRANTSGGPGARGAD